MRAKQRLRVCVDALMTCVLLLLVGYSMVGETAHEWLGIGMFALFVTHHVLNRRWYRNLFRGKYTLHRALLTLCASAALISMLGSFVSAVVLSKHVFAFLPISGGSAWAREVHMMCGYWNFTLLSLHLGLHWSMILAMARKGLPKPSKKRKWLARGIALAIAAYGVYAFAHRQIGAYMLGQIRFAFFDFGEPLWRFELDYIAAMGLLVCVSYYLGEIAKRVGRRKAK